MEQGSGYLGGGGALSLQTQMLFWDRLTNIHGERGLHPLHAPLMPSTRVWSSWIVQSEIILQQSPQLAGQIPDILAYEKIQDSKT